MAAITLTKRLSDFVNVPAAFELGDTDDGSRAGVTVADYELPAGYQLGETVMGVRAIFDPRGYACDIIDQRGRPALVTGAGIEPLRRVVTSAIAEDQR